MLLPGAIFMLLKEASSPLQVVVSSGRSSRGSRSRSSSGGSRSRNSCSSSGCSCCC